MLHSLVVRFVRDEEVTGSNPAIPTMENCAEKRSFCFSGIKRLMLLFLCIAYESSDGFSLRQIIKQIQSKNPFVICICDRVIFTDFYNHLLRYAMILIPVLFSGI